MTIQDNFSSVKREILTNSDGSNKYDLQILTNWYKSSDEFEGNGIYTSYVEGKFCNNEVFIAYPHRGQFYIEVGKNFNKTVQINRIPVVSPDIYKGYERIPEIYFKYVNQLIDSYAACIEQDCQ